MKLRLLVGLAAVCGALALAVIARSDPHPLGWSLWLAGLGAAWGAALVHDREQASRPELRDRVALRRGDVLAMVLLALVALALRLYGLSPTLPPMHGDEGEMGMLARLAAHGPGGDRGAAPLAVFGTAFLDHPTLFHHIQAVALAVGGDSIEALRGLSAVFGALCIPLVYAFGRIGWNRTVGFVAAWLLAVSHLHLHFSRIALNNIETTWCACLLALLLVIAWAGAPAGSAGGAPSAPRLSLFVVIGFVLGGSQYFYLGSRLLVVVAALALVALLRAGRATFSELAAAAASTLLVVAPLLIALGRLPDGFAGRMRFVGAFTPQGLHHVLGAGSTWPRDLPRLAAVQLERNFSFLVGRGDSSSFYQVALGSFDAVTLTLFWLGAGAVLLRWRRFPAAMLLLWLGLGLLLGGVMTNDAPNGPRLLVVVPAVCLVAGVAAGTLRDLVRRWWPRGERATSGVAAGVLCAVTLYLGASTYFVRFPTQPTYGYLAEMGILMRERGSMAEVYLLGAPHLYAMHGTLRFLRDGVPATDVVDAGELPDIRRRALAAHQRLLVIAVAQRREELARFAAEFPGGVWGDHEDAIGRPTFARYELPPGGP